MRGHSHRADWLAPISKMKLSCENNTYIFISCRTKSWFSPASIWLANSLRGGWAPFVVAQIPIFRQGQICAPRKGKSEAKYCRTPPGEAKRLPVVCLLFWGDPIQTKKLRTSKGRLVEPSTGASVEIVFFVSGWYSSIPCQTDTVRSSLWFLQHADRSFKRPIVFTALQLQFHMLSELLAKFRSQFQWLTTTSSTPKNLHKRFKWFLRIVSDHVKQIRSKLYQATVSRTQMPHCLEESDAVRFLTLSWLAQKDTSLKHVGRLLMVFWQTGACSIVGVGIEWSIFIAWGRLERQVL